MSINPENNTKYDDGTAKHSRVDFKTFLTTFFETLWVAGSSLPAMMVSPSYLSGEACEGLSFFVGYNLLRAKKRA